MLVALQFTYVVSKLIGSHDWEFGVLFSKDFNDVGCLCAWFTHTFQFLYLYKFFYYGYKGSSCPIFNWKNSNVATLTVIPKIQFCSDFLTPLLYLHL